MKFIFNLLALLVVLLLLLVGAAFIAVRFLGADLIEEALNKDNPFEVDVNQASLIFAGAGGGLSIKGIEIENPEGFPTDEFLDVSEVTAAIALSSLFKEELVIPQLTLRIPRLSIVRAQDNNTNLVLFLGGLAMKTRSKSDGGEARPFLIRNLILELDRVEIIDYRTGGEPTRQSVNQALRIELTDVRSVNQIGVALTQELGRLGTRVVGTWLVNSLNEGFTERAQGALNRFLRRDE
jgi:uncharacterized protein YhdP